MQVVVNYVLIGAGIVFAIWIVDGIFFGRLRKGGMVRERPPHRRTWPIWLFFLAIYALVVFSIASPHP